MPNYRSLLKSLRMPNTATKNAMTLPDPTCMFPKTKTCRYWVGSFEFAYRNGTGEKICPNHLTDPWVIRKKINDYLGQKRRILPTQACTHMQTPLHFGSHYFAVPYNAVRFIYSNKADENRLIRCIIHV